VKNIYIGIIAVLCGVLFSASVTMVLSSEKIIELASKKERRELEYLSRELVIPIWNKYQGFETPSFDASIDDNFGKQEVAEAIYQYEGFSRRYFDSIWLVWYFHHMARLRIISGDLNNSPLELQLALKALDEASNEVVRILKKRENTYDITYLEQHNVSKNIERDKMWVYSLLFQVGGTKEISYQYKAKELLKELFGNCSGATKHKVKNKRVLHSLSCTTQASFNE